MLIALEGLSGTGKTTIGRSLAQKFNNAAFVEEFAPDFADGYIQKLIERDAYLRMHPSIPTPKSQAMVFMAALMYKYETQVVPSLEAGKTVIVDRYVDSIRAIQPETISMQQKSFGDQDTEWLSLCLRPLQRPDKIFLFDSDIEIIEQRLKVRGINSISEDARAFMRKIRENYTEILSGDPAASFLSNEGAIEEVVDTAYQQVCRSASGGTTVRNTVRRPPAPGKPDGGT